MQTANTVSNGTGALPRAPLGESAEQDSTLSVGAPSKPLFGVLPIARLIPQDIHSVMDYANSGLFFVEGITTDDDTAMIASLALGVAGAGVSLVTDYKLSVAKVIPVEAHEVIDYAWSAAAIAAPFVFGYWKTAPKVALMHVVAGAGTIIASLLTDYRAYSKRKRR
jgi:hypothetical protein